MRNGKLYSEPDFHPLLKIFYLRLLEPFVQVENEFSRTQSGTGLGLPLTKQLIELHGGTLELLSTEGEGTTARAIFPTTRIVREVADRAVA